MTKKKKRQYRQGRNAREREKKSGGAGQEKAAAQEQDFRTEDKTFSEKDAFAGEAEDGIFHSKRLDRLEKQAQKSGRKAEKARAKLPKKREYALKRVFDEKTGKAEYVLTTVKTERTVKADNAVKRAARRLSAESAGYAHSRITEAEKDNV